MTRRVQLVIEVSGDELLPAERCRVRVVDTGASLSVLSGRELLSADFWDGGPEVAPAVAGFVTTWLHEAFWVTAEHRGRVT